MRLEFHKHKLPLTSPATSITGDYYENVVGQSLQTNSMPNSIPIFRRQLTLLSLTAFASVI